MSRSGRSLNPSALYDSPSLQRQQPRRSSHSPSRSSSVSSTTSSYLTFSKEEDISLPPKRPTSALAEQLRASQSRREKSVSRSSSASHPDGQHWSVRRDADDDCDDSHPLVQSAADDVGPLTVAPASGRLPYECKVFVHRSVLGFIATQRHRAHKRSISSSSSSPLTDSPSVSPSVGSTLSSNDFASLPCVTFHVNEVCSLQRLACELIASCIQRSTPHRRSSSPPVDILALSKSFRLVAATPSGRVDEDCPALSPLQAVHQFNLSHFLFVLNQPDQPVPWALFSLPADEIHIGPRVLLSSLPSLLLQACSDGDIDRVRVLLDEGVGVDSADEAGQTGLHLATTTGHVPVLHLLCKRGADVDRRSKKGKTALMLGVQGGQVECVEALLLWGCSLWVTDDEEKNVLALATECGGQEMRDLILNADSEEVDLDPNADAWDQH